MTYRKTSIDKPLVVDCEICGADLYPSKYGRVKRYCSEKCRKEAQRRRENSERIVQETLAEQQLIQRCVTLPAQVVEKLEQMKRIYGVYVALDALDIAMLLIADRNVTEQKSRNIQDTGAYPFKSWLRDRLRQGKRDTIDALAKRVVADSRLPAQGSKSLYTALLRAKKYEVEDVATFNQAWEEMSEQL